MRYVTGMYALNLRVPEDETTGDWHSLSLDWENIEMRESEDSVFGDWGIGTAHLPDGSAVACADHLRACLDLIEQGRFGLANQMQYDYLDDDDSLVPIIFEQVALLEGSGTWDEVDGFMGREYHMKWLRYKRSVGIEDVAAGADVGRALDGAGIEARRNNVHDLVEAVNALPDNPFILKGCNALHLCYGAPRVSEDIDFDAPNDSHSNGLLEGALVEYCQDRGFGLAEEKDAAREQHLVIQHPDGSQLKVGASYRPRPYLGDVCTIHGVQTYGIERIYLQTLHLRGVDNRLDVLCDLAYIVANFYSELSEQGKGKIRNLFYADDREDCVDRIRYLIETQGRALGDVDQYQAWFPDLIEKIYG